MRLNEYIQKTNAVDRKLLSSENAMKLLKFLEAGISMSELVESHRDLLGTFSGPHIRRLSDARRQWQELEVLRESILAEHPDIPDEVFSLAVSVRRMEALRHILPHFPVSAYSGVPAYSEAVRAALEVWTGALNLSTKKGTVMAMTNARSVPRHLEALVGKAFDIFSITREQWGVLKNGEAEGIIRLEFEYPVSSMETHLEAVKGRLGPVGTEKTTGELMDLLVLGALSDALRTFLDNRMREEIFKEISVQYVDVLKVPPVKAQRLGAFCPDNEKQNCGLVVLNEKGKSLAHAVLPLDEDWCERARVFFVEQKTAYVVIPGFVSEFKDILQEFREKEGGFLVFMPVRADGLEEAVSLLEESTEAIPGPSAGALVLGRRLMFPAREWAVIDPLMALEIDLPEDVEKEELRAYLKEQRGLILLDAGLDRIPPRVLPVAHSGGLLAAGKLNPSIRTFDDVKMGMVLTGIIINITKFGAFINIGLNQEALVHVSELSDEFVSDPFEVVSLGQQVKATVVAIDTEKNRISLSLRTNPKPLEPRSRMRDDRRRPGRDERYTSPASRSQALKDLENLFNK